MAAVNATWDVGADKVKEKWLDYLEPLPINLLWIAAVFDPIGHFFGLRYAALILVYVALFLRILNGGVSIKVGGVYFFLFVYFVLIIPVYGVLMYLLRGAGGAFIDTSYIGAAVLFACSLVYLNPEGLRIGLESQKIALRMMAGTIIFCVFIYEVGLPIFLIGNFVEKGVAFFGPFRNYGGQNFYYMYFVASPMLIYLVVQEAWALFETKGRSQLFWCGMAVVALFLSGTRANILLAVFAVPFVYLWRRWGWAAIPAVLSLSAICLLMLHFLGVQAIGSMFDPQNESIELKLGFLAGYLKIFSDVVTLLFGQGFNAHVWSGTFGDMLPGGAYGGASKTELTYLEIIRVFGVFFGGLFFYLMLVFLKKLSEIDLSLRWMAPAVFLYMVGSAFNPYLFSSNGMLPLGLCAAALQGYVLMNTGFPGKRRSAV